MKNNPGKEVSHKAAIDGRLIGEENPSNSKKMCEFCAAV